MKIKITQVKNPQRPDLTFRWEVKHRGGTSSSCTDTEANAILAACDTAVRESLWWANHDSQVD